MVSVGVGRVGAIVDRAAVSSLRWRALGHRAAVKRIVAMIVVLPILRSNNRGLIRVFQRSVEAVIMTIPTVEVVRSGIIIVLAAIIAAFSRVCPDRGEVWSGHFVLVDLRRRCIKRNTLGMTVE